MLSLDFLGKYFLYLKERFPILPTLLFSLSYCALAIGLASFSGNKIYLLLSLSGIFFFFLLRLRVTDEFKDENHDRIHYPNRPLQRGLISKKDLISIGIIAFLAELYLANSVGGFYYYLPIVIYSFLMSVEFLIPKFLNKHFTIYFLTHEVVFVFYSMFFLSVLKIDPGLLKFWLSLAALICFPTAVEIIRKFSPRKDSSGVEVADSYSSVWGRRISLFALSSLIVAIGFFTAVVKSNFLLLILAVTCLVILGTFVGKKDKKIPVISAVYLVLVAFLVNL